MNEIKLKNRYKLSIKRIKAGDISGQDIKAIVAFQLKGYVKEGDEPFDDVELALMAGYMIAYN